MSRATRQDKERRIRLVESLQVRGVASYQIVQILIQKESLSERQAWRYLQEAKNELQAMSATDHDTEPGLLRKRLEFLYQRAIQKENDRLALSILKQQSHCHQQFQKDKPHAHTSATSTRLSIELAEALHALETEGTIKPSEHRG